MGDLKEDDNVFQTIQSKRLHYMQDLGLGGASEEVFLAGRRSRGADLDSAIRIFLEFLRGYEFFGDLDRPGITVFGSARFKPSHIYYKLARSLGKRLANALLPTPLPT